MIVIPIHYISKNLIPDFFCIWLLLYLILLFITILFQQWGWWAA